MSMFDSGITTEKYEIDSILPGIKASVRINMSRVVAEDLIRWYNRDDLRFVRRAAGLLDDSDSFCDELIEAVHAWVATFPLLVASLRE